MRLIDSLEAQGFFTTEQAAQLKAAYCAYRDYGHRQVLQGNKAIAKEDGFAKQRHFVETLWSELMM